MHVNVNYFINIESVKLLQQHVGIFFENILYWAIKVE